MNRNTPSRFTLAPQVNIERSTFPMNPRRLTSFDVGQCIPVFCAPVLPGDSWKCKTSYVARMQTLKTPVMDDIQLSKYWFFVPDRLLWTHFEEFMGANKTSAWIPSAEYTLPKITSPDGGWAVGSLADHLGVPPLVPNLTIQNSLRFRAYSKIMNDWFVSDSIMDPIVMETGDSTVSGSNGSNYITDVDKGGMPFVACRNHDMFSSALFEPQRGPDVSINAFVDNQQLPVYATAFPNAHFNYAAGKMDDYASVLSKSYPMMLETNNPQKFSVDTDIAYPYFFRGATSDHSGNTSFDLKPYSTATIGGLASSVLLSGSADFPKTVLNTDNLTIYQASGSVTGLTPVNLVAESSGKYLWTSINDLRQAFQVQRFYEKAARAGSGRYIEIIRAHFGVTSPDARLQRSEYLGGNTRRLNVRQITQTSSTVETSPMGDVAGMSVTGDYDFDFEKSFTEHGYLMCIVVARYNHTYQQGLDPDLLRSGIFSMYWPSFAHLGEQPVKNACIYAQGYDPTPVDGVVPDDVDNEVFGYQEAWWDYRMIQNSVCGMMRSVSNSGLDSWHYADKYDELPHLSAGWLQEDKTNVDRCLAVTSAVSNQIFADFQFDMVATRPLPLYSIPGLIDHF